VTTHIYSRFLALRNRVAAAKVPAAVKQGMRFARDEEGVTAIEYGLIAALIAVAIIVAVTSVGATLSDLFSDIAGEL